MKTFGYEGPLGCVLFGHKFKKYVEIEEECGPYLRVHELDIGFCRKCGFTKKYLLRNVK